MPWDFVLILLFLAVVLPIKGRSRMKKLLAKSHVSSLERVNLYATTISFQWVMAAMVAWRCWARGLTATDLGLVLPGAPQILAAAAIGAVALFVLQSLNMRRMSRLPAQVRGPMQAVAQRILPQSEVEMLIFVGLGITAAVCEEFLYRGFAMAAFRMWGWPTAAGVMASSALFGLGHIYQGKGGAIGTFLLGLGFGVGRIVYQSLIPPMAWHCAVDLAAGLSGPKYLIEKKG